MIFLVWICWSFCTLTAVKLKLKSDWSDLHTVAPSPTICARIRLRSHTSPGHHLSLSLSKRKIKNKFEFKRNRCDANSLQLTATDSSFFILPECWFDYLVLSFRTAPDARRRPEYVPTIIIIFWRRWTQTKQSWHYVQFESSHCD